MKIKRDQSLVLEIGTARIRLSRIIMAVVLAVVLALLLLQVTTQSIGDYSPPAVIKGLQAEATAAVTADSE